MTLDKDLLKRAQLSIQKTIELEKSGFVPMPGGQGEPVAGASPMTAALTAPMGGGMPQGDPAGIPVDPATGMPIDPATGLPADPAAAGLPADPGIPPPPLEPAPAETVPADGMIQMPVSQLIELIQVLGSGKPVSDKPKAQSDVGAKLDQILAYVAGRG